MARLTVCIYIEILKEFMPYYEVANLVTITKMNMIDEMACAYGMLRTTSVKIPHQVSHQGAQWSPLLLKSPTDLRRGLSCSNF